MFTFLQPLGLWAAAGIIIPIIIHLWNVKQGKILQVGSIALIIESDRQQAKSIQLKDLLLLLIRCLLIIALALLLAKPFYQQQLTVQKQKGWLLISKNDLQPAYKQFKLQIDSLTTAGYRFHYFEPGFKETTLQSALASTDSTSTSTNYWSLLKALDQEVPAELPVYIFTSNQLKKYRGNRPAVDMNLTWNTYDNADSFATFISGTYKTSNGATRIILTQSRPTANTVSYRDVSFAQLPPEFSMSNDTAGTIINYTDSLRHTSSCRLDTTSKSFVVFTDNYLKDASYVEAALKAIKTTGDYAFDVSVTKTIDRVSENADWIFWLSEAPIPQRLQNKKVFQYATGKEMDINSLLEFNEQQNASARQMALYKLIKHAAGQNEETVWSDGFGDAVLTRSLANPFHYKFYSRFNPAWSDLVWNEQFPALLQQLIFDDGKEGIHSLDKRIIDAAQIQSLFLKKAAENKQKFVRRTDLKTILWLVAFALLCLERILSFTRKKEASFVAG